MEGIYPFNSVICILHCDRGVIEKDPEIFSLQGLSYSYLVISPAAQPRVHKVA